MIAINTWLLLEGRTHLGFYCLLNRIMAMYMVREGLVDANSFIGKNNDRSEFVTFTPDNELSFAHVALIILESKKANAILMATV
jgi:hypothetical protein